MKKVILISGKMGSGKTTLANALLLALADLISGFITVMKFAEPLYIMHNYILNKIVSYAAEHGIEKMMAELPFILHNYVLNKMHSWTGIHLGHDDELFNFFKEYVKTKVIDGKVVVPKKDGDLLQYLGTNFGRTKYGESVWVDILKKLVEDSPHEVIIIDDCRFPNELLAFPDALSIRLDAPTEVRKNRCSMWRQNDQHPSEIALDELAATGGFKLYLDTLKTSKEECVKKILAVYELKFGNLTDTNTVSEGK